MGVGETFWPGLSRAQHVPLTARSPHERHRDLRISRRRYPFISHKQAIEKAEAEFEAYRAREMRELESDFDRAIRRLEG